MVVTRRRSMKRWEMRGGLQNKIADNTHPVLGTFVRLDTYIQLHNMGRFPIFSQKRGICATDAFTNVFWWADGIREHFWRAEVYSKNGIYDTRLKTVAGTVVEAETGGDVTMSEAAQLIVKLSLHRLVSLFTKNVLTLVERYGVPPMMLRSSSAQILGVGVETGEVCALYTIKYNNGSSVKINPADVADIPTFATNPQRTEALMKSAFDKYCPGLANVGTTIGAEYTPVAIILRTVFDNSGHRTVCVRIGEIWHHMDNNTGFSIPLVKSEGHPLTFDEINAGTFRISYGYETGTKKNFTNISVISNGTEMFSSGKVLYELQGDAIDLINPITWEEDRPKRQLVGYKSPPPTMRTVIGSLGEAQLFTDASYNLHSEVIQRNPPIPRAFQTNITIFDGLTQDEVTTYTYLKSQADTLEKLPPDATDKIIDIGNEVTYFMSKRQTRDKLETLSLPSLFRTLSIACSIYADIAEPYISAILKTKDFRLARGKFNIIDSMYKTVKKACEMSKETADDVSALAAMMYPHLNSEYAKFKQLETQIAEAEKAVVPPQSSMQSIPTSSEPLYVGQGLKTAKHRRGRRRTHRRTRGERRYARILKTVHSTEGATRE